MRPAACVRVSAMLNDARYARILKTDCEYYTLEDGIFVRSVRAVESSVLDDFQAIA